MEGGHIFILRLKENRQRPTENNRPEYKLDLKDYSHRCLSCQIKTLSKPGHVGLHKKTGDQKTCT